MLDVERAIMMTIVDHHRSTFHEDTSDTSQKLHPFLHLKKIEKRSHNNEKRKKMKFFKSGLLLVLLLQFIHFISAQKDETKCPIDVALIGATEI